MAFALPSLCLMIFVAGCADLGGIPPDAGAMPDGVFPDGGASLAQDVQPLFTRSCVYGGCHAVAGAAQGLVLVDGMARAHLVGVPSAGAPGLPRVQEGDPERSYLVSKLQDRQIEVGGDGRRMPLGQNPWPQVEIDVVIRWIRSGARDN